MNFKALRAFTLVTEFGSITAAADKLSLSPPAVSRLISQLEAETRVRLFDRTHRGLSPTEAGHLFMKEAQRILTDLEELPDVIRTIRRQTSQRLSILTTPRLVPGLVLPAIARFGTRHPDVRCILDIQPKWELERSLTRNRYDLCAAILPVPINTLTTRPLYRIASELLMPEGHPLAALQQVTAENLKNEKLIGFLPGQLLRRQISDFFRSAGIEMEFAMEVSSSVTAADLTRRGCGLSIVDRLMCSGMPLAGLTSVPFHPAFWTTAGVLFAKAEQPSDQANEFVACMLDVLTDFAKQDNAGRCIEIFAPQRAAPPPWRPVGKPPASAKRSTVRARASKSAR
jgi:DNA-binding transcriptional LysR family regulator